MSIFNKEPVSKIMIPIVDKLMKDHATDIMMAFQRLLNDEETAMSFFSLLFSYARPDLDKYSQHVQLQIISRFFLDMYDFLDYYVKEHTHAANTETIPSPSPESVSTDEK